jgi:hypothetical protein
LRHQRDEFAFGWQMRKVRKLQKVCAYLSTELAYFLMRQFQKLFEESELVHHFERRWMHSVAAKITQEIGVLFEHDRLDARTREQKAEHHSGGAAAGNTTIRFDLHEAYLSLDSSKSQSKFKAAKTIKFIDLHV